MLKKYILMIFIICFAVIGCKKEDNNDVNTMDNILNSDIQLYSDNTKKVFEESNNRHVFYFKGNEITGYHTYVEYDDSNEAKEAFQKLESDDFKNVNKCYLKGKYIVFEWNKSEYGNTKVSDLETKYAHMKEVKEK